MHPSLLRSFALLLVAASAAAPAGALVPPAEARQPRLIASSGDPARIEGAIESIRREGGSKPAARRFDEAIREYERLHALDPGNADVVAHLAQFRPGPAITTRRSCSIGMRSPGGLETSDCRATSPTCSPGRTASRKPSGFTSRCWR